VPDEKFEDVAHNRGRGAHVGAVGGCRRCTKRFCSYPPTVHRLVEDAGRGRLVHGCRLVEGLPAGSGRCRLHHRPAQGPRGAEWLSGRWQPHRGMDILPRLALLKLSEIAEAVVRRLKDPSEVRSHAPAARSTVRPIRVDERLLPPHLFRPVPSAKKPTFEPTNPSQDVARSCTPLRKNRGTTIWTRRNATARHDLTRAATVLSYLRIRRLGIRVPPSALTRDM
jgi:hypothetical protein